ncbi:MAG: hypothetical protein NWE93_07240 [Candidatus Bathyarchaeota archaeon]|nr:hypothetical protein [Candidatus Bathyarchaeota archaeon]
MNQPIRRRCTPQTHAGQYMCVECGEIFDTKKEVENHRHQKHNPNLRSTRRELYVF